MRQFSYNFQAEEGTGLTMNAKIRREKEIKLSQIGLIIVFGNIYLTVQLFVCIILFQYFAPATVSSGSPTSGS